MRPGYLRPGSYKAWFSTLAPDFTHESTFFTYFSTYS
jgi:hypothetical protein